MEENKCNKVSTIEELVMLNKLFTKRYTDEDKEYIQMAESHSKTPPILDDWDDDRNNYRNQRYRQNNHNRYHHQQRQYNNYSHDNRYRRDRSRSPPSYPVQRR
ncbi:hypothetical protein I4U23_025846 [Adineta vaga]|nr:hypothetical protein I4U23_025846 [Adineta vaga]